VILNDTNKLRDVYVAVSYPIPSRRELISLLADVGELPLHVLLNRFKQACQAGHGKYSRLMNIQVNPKSDRKIGEIENDHSLLSVD
jgi:hypothetical protein